MPIILNEEEAFKNDLLKQSLRQEVGFKLSKNHSFSTPKETFYNTKFPPRLIDHSLSDWNEQSDPSLHQKTKVQRFILPEMNHRRRSKNIEELSRQLLKYEQFNSDDNIEHQKFRLTILKQMTKVNFKKESPQKQTESPKKINLKLPFPEKYQRYQPDNYEQKNSDESNIFRNGITEDMVGSFYAKKTARGLIPSIKKLVSSSFPKKSIFRSESERDPYQRKKLLMNKEDWENAKKSITDEIQQKFIEHEKSERQRKVKKGRKERHLPINFLSYSHRKHSIEQEEQNMEEKSKRKKSPYLVHMPMNSLYPKSQKPTQEELYEHKRLSECIFLNVTKKKQSQQ